MKTWKQYAQTYRDQEDIFDFARQGNLRGLVDMFAHNFDSTAQLNTDINSRNSRGYSALMLAVYNGEKDFCEALLRLGADVNSTDFVGNTVLMAAAFKGNLNIFKLLLSYGADSKLINQSNMTIKDWASMFGRKDILQFIDENDPENEKTSKLKIIFRFLKLGLLAFKSQHRMKK